jgi:dipeptidyl aminopeptidase/acylaminoacyl peptidase
MRMALARAPRHKRPAVRIATITLALSLALVASASGTAPSVREATAQGEIAFQSDRGGNLDIYVVDADGSRRRRLTTSRGDDCCRPVWSPKGRKILFASERDGNSEIYVMSAGGRDQRRLTTNPAVDFFPSWSPDGRRIAFTRGRGDEFERGEKSHSSGCAHGDSRSLW